MLRGGIPKINNQRSSIVNPNGFTLVELLVASGIAGLVVAGLSTSFALGISAWHRVQKIQQVQAAIALEKWAAQFSSSPLFGGIPFQAEADRVAFPTLIRTVGKDGSASWMLGRAEYFFDSQAHAFCLREQSYGEFLQGSTPPARCLASGIQRIQVEFLQEKEGEVPHWDLQWEPAQGQKVPWAVRITLVLESPTGEEAPIIKTAVHPVQ